MTEDEALRLAEALVFASAGPVGARALSQILPETAWRWRRWRSSPTISR